MHAHGRATVVLHEAPELTDDVKDSLAGVVDADEPGGQRRVELGCRPGGWFADVRDPRVGCAATVFDEEGDRQMGCRRGHLRVDAPLVPLRGLADQAVSPRGPGHRHRVEVRRPR
ncbi:MAG: hypothetical protein V9G08_05290 [Dermatophilaceae bacterium]